MCSYLLLNANCICTPTKNHARSFDHRTRADGALLPTTLPSSTTIIDYTGQGYSGAIPTQFGLLTNLKSLGLGTNDLNSSIPTELGMLTETTSIMLYSNKLASTVPSELGLTTKVTELSISGNDISGQLPTQIGSLVSIVRGHSGDCTDCFLLRSG